VEEGEEEGDAEEEDISNSARESPSLAYPDIGCLMKEGRGAVLSTCMHHARRTL
jgi:hypothetical protein